MVTFPTPIGGNITDDDIGRKACFIEVSPLTCVPVPCAIFVALHALLLPAIAWNYFKRHQWNTAVIGSTIYAIER